MIQRCACAALWTLVTLGAGGSVLGRSAPAAAYSEPALFEADAVVYGGGGGRFFTGSPRDGFTCEVCHTDASPLELQLDGLPPRRYEPGAFYIFEVSWPQDQRATIVSEMVGPEGDAIGELTVPPPESRTPADLCLGGGFAPTITETPDGRVVASTPACGASRMRLGWRAPDEVIEDAWLHVAAVAGDGSEDPYGDAIDVIARPLSRRSEATSGCRLGDADRAHPLLALALLLALVGARRRRRT